MKHAYSQHFGSFYINRDDERLPGGLYENSISQSELELISTVTKMFDGTVVKFLGRDETAVRKAS